jgi:hypothetical protein
VLRRGKPECKRGAENNPSKLGQHPLLVVGVALLAGSGGEDAVAGMSGAGCPRGHGIASFGVRSLLEELGDTMCDADGASARGMGAFPTGAAPRRVE